MNPKKLVVFQEILDRIPAVAEALGRLDLDITPISGGKEAISKIWGTQPGFVLLDVAMPQLSGIEACRQIKEGGLFPQTRVVLLSSVDSATIAARAEDAGCDLYVVESEAAEKIPTFFGLAPVGASGDASGGSAPEALSAPPPPRIDASGPIQVSWETSKNVGDLMNLSLNGALFAFGEVIPNGTAVTLQFPDHTGSDLTITGQIIRTVALKEWRRGLPLASGAKFSNLSEERLRRLSTFLVALAEAKKLAASIQPEFVSKVIESNVLELSPTILNAGPGTPFSFLEPLTDYERNSFSLKEARDECVQTMICLRAKCELLEAFIPRVQADPGTFGDTFLEKVNGIISQVEAIADEVDAYVKAAVEAEEEEQRLGLNQVTTRLHDRKNRLMFKVADGVTLKVAGPGTVVLERIWNQVEDLRGGRDDSTGEVKYRRKVQKPAPAKEEKKKKDKKTKRDPSSHLIRNLVLVGITVVTVGTYMLSGYLTSIVDPEEIDILIPIERVEREDRGLVIEVRVREWDQLKGPRREEALDKLEAYMREEKLQQSKVMDETGRLLAAISAGSTGPGQPMGRRIFRQ